MPASMSLAAGKFAGSGRTLLGSVTEDLDDSRRSGACVRNGYLSNRC